MGSVTDWPRSRSSAEAVLLWTVMQPTELVTEHQLSHWDPVCHRPHLTRGTLPKAVLLELSLDERILAAACHTLQINRAGSNVHQQLQLTIWA